MTQLIVYINSEQKASAYYDDCYVSFHGTEYESDLTEFAQILKDELRADPLSEIKDGISILIVSNGGTNKTVRTVINNLLHTDTNEEELLNVDVKELNVIEAKYFLQLLGNPQNPEAKDFAKYFELENNISGKSQEIEELKTEISNLKKELDDKNSMIKELQDFKNSIKNENEKKIAKLKQKVKNYYLCSVDFCNDRQWKKKSYFSAFASSRVYFHSLCNDGAFVKTDADIALYNGTTYEELGQTIEPCVAQVIKTRNSGKIYYLVEDNQPISDKQPVAIVGDFDSLEEAKTFARNQKLI